MRDQEKEKKYENETQKEKRTGMRGTRCVCAGVGAKVCLKSEQLSNEL